jgi:hypothetical protein
MVSELCISMDGMLLFFNVFPPDCDVNSWYEGESMSYYGARGIQ